MFCPKCGTTNSDEAQFCIACGYSLTAEPPVPMPEYGPMTAMAETKTSGLAIAALTLGIISLIPCLGCFTFIPGLILGIVALVKIGNSQGFLKGKGLAVGGIVTSVLPIFILPLSAFIFRHDLGQVICHNNLKEINSAIVDYQDQYDMQLPENLEILSERYHLDRNMLFCPADLAGQKPYVYRGSDLPAEVFRERVGADELILVHDNFGNHQDQTGETRNVLFANRNIKKVTEAEFQQLIERDNELRRQLHLAEKPPG